MVRRADWMEVGSAKSLRRRDASVAMRLGPGTSEWRSVPIVKGVVMGPTSCAGCHWALLPARACQVLSLGMRSSGPFCGVMRIEAAKAVETTGAGTLVWATTLTRISLSPGLRSGPISSQSKAPHALCCPVTTPLTVATYAPGLTMCRLARIGAASRCRG